jgi:hypothetical protein
MSPKRPFLNLVALALVVGGATAVTASTATGTAPAKPVIGKPVAQPSQAAAGKRFAVSFRVTRAGTSTPFTAGKMTVDASIAGQEVAHAASFRGGTVRLSLVVPADAAGKTLKVKVTIKVGGKTVTRVATFRIQGAPTPSLSIGDLTGAEGNAGTTTFSFTVTLSAASTKTVTVDYATADGTATAPSDYAAASGKLTFQPGEKVKTIPVGVVGDLAIEPDETFTVTLSNASGATIAKATATGTITNDDTASPVTAGGYKGATQEGNFVFFSVLPSRMITGFRVNNVSEDCGGGKVSGSVSWGTLAFPIASNGSFTAQGSWTGSDKQGDVEWTSETWQITGLFATATTATGTLSMSDELNYQGAHYRCSSGTVTWSATFQG